MPRHIRLEVGSFAGGEDKVGEGYLDKKVMLVYSGHFESMDGPVTIKDEDIEQLASVHNSFMSKLSRLATGDIPLKYSPPIQLDHSTSARDTVGRLVGNLEVGDYDDEGQTKKALFGTARILGAENIEKVKDGRWIHVSMGADLENHKLTELTITPFPAAANASLLSKKTVKSLGKDVGTVEYKGYYCNIIKTKDGFWAVPSSWIQGGPPEDGPYDSKEEAARAGKRLLRDFVKEHGQEDTDFSNGVASDINDAKRKSEDAASSMKLSVMGSEWKIKKLSQGDDEMPGYKDLKSRMEMYEKCKKHLMDEKKMSEEDAEEKLAEMSYEDVEKMAADEDERAKKLAEEEDKKKAAMAALTVHGGELTKLSKAFKETQGKVELAAKKTKLSARLAKLKSEAKITPAELKKIDLAELAAKDDQTVDAIFEAYEKREPLVNVGLYGSTKALTAGQLDSHLKRARLSRLELETMLNMPSKRDYALKRLAEMDGEPQYGETNVHVDVVPGGEHMAGYDAAWTEACKMMDEGKKEEAKAHMKKFIDGLLKPAVTSDMSLGEAESEMSALAEEVKKMQTTFVDFVKLTAPHFGLKADELV